MSVPASVMVQVYVLKDEVAQRWTVKYSEEMTNHYDVKMSECHSSFEILIISTAKLFRLVKSTVYHSLGLPLLHASR